MERILIAVKLRVKPPKRRSPSSRLKSRLYYRRNRAKIRLQRRRYMRTHKSVLKHRKMFMRYKPAWFKKVRKPKPHKAPKPKRLKLTIPRAKRPKKPKSLGKKIFRHR